MGTYNYNFFQISSAGPDNNGASDQQTREPKNKISSFGVLSYGPKDANDYTKVTTGFKSKDELQNPIVPEARPSGNGNWTGAESNPNLVGYTLQKSRNEISFIMTFGTRVSKPIADVMDTFVAYDTSKLKRLGYNALYFPDEGVKYFGTRASGSSAGPVLVVETSGPPI